VQTGVHSISHIVNIVCQVCFSLLFAVADRVRAPKLRWGADTQKGAESGGGSPSPTGNEPRICAFVVRANAVEKEEDGEKQRGKQDIDPLTSTAWPSSAGAAPQ